MGQVSAHSRRLAQDTRTLTSMMITRFSSSLHRPFAMIGHSLGEFVAAAAAGALSVSTALALVCERGFAMEANPSIGSMLSLQASDADARKAIDASGQQQSVVVAAVNTRDSCVLSGENRVRGSGKLANRT